ncbi:hypothetical protein ACFQ07_29405 [Actinomadura adrarensis]|uniref:Uncharacterized protein n=1 Tax=Actinomadura adrarensis TaxID=1819600 RepID=A0ABW3CPC2_9ACTN
MSDHLRALSGGLGNARPIRQCSSLSDEISTGAVNLARMPEPTMRQLFEAFRLEMRYDRRTNKVHCQVTTAPAVIPAQRTAASAVLKDQRPAQDNDRARVYGLPPAGSQPDTCTQHIHNASCTITLPHAYALA